MTERLYYRHQDQTTFSATIVARLEWEGHPAVVLDRTAFYPESGGQPADRGELDGVAVLDVVARDLGGEIVHVLAAEIPGPKVRGVVDWDRRFDHMQQHSGQHVLSAAFERVLGAETVASHVGSDVSTIDVRAARLGWELIEGVESLANRVIWEDRRMAIRFVEPAEVDALTIRRSPKVEGPVRIVEVGPSRQEPGASFDINPCGGTHVSRTGEIGIVKIVRLGYRGDQTRVEFLCGGRALRDYRSRSEVTNQLASNLTVGYWEVGQAVDRLREEARSLRRQLDAAEKRLIDVEASDLVHQAIDVGSQRVVKRVWENRPPGTVRALALALVEYPRMLAILASVGGHTDLCFARAEAVGVDVSDLMRQVCARLEGKGGGRTHLAQGSAKVADPSEVEAALSELVSGLSRAVDVQALGPVHKRS